MKDALTTWLRGDSKDRHDYYRDTYGGRQYLTKCDDEMWELTQEGYSTPLIRGKEQSLCMRYANNMAAIENFQIANKSAYDFANELFFGTARTIKALLKSTNESAEEGLKQVAQLEGYLMMLRHRLVQRTDVQSLASRGEEACAKYAKHVTMFYAELMHDQHELAANRLDEIKSLTEDLYTELVEMVGDTGSRS